MRMRMLCFSLLLGVVSSALCAQDFFKDEVLCDTGEGGTAMKAWYAVAKVAKAAEDPGTDQSEVVFSRNGIKASVDFVIASHKAKKAEMKEDTIVFWPDVEKPTTPLTTKAYRDAYWRIGSITAVAELYKDIVEVDGRKFIWKILRIPDNPSDLEENME